MRYEIRVRGSVDPDRLADLGDISVAIAGRDTILECRVPDVAALVGILRALTHEGLAVREIRTVDGGTG
ncbi:hypothetical protein EXU48_06730 [Occultella glacieicola]|uniref:Uncharacterized protein n=1 Tax=Occultella glacieicola TaxID=2518684 RepID=A0ABY2E7X8_9MICO|nr:hypothetical protein [Occultella glacieicola]TDE95941.1 hypothetical protein EXU48_06730 [Occultella glacieicola]